MAGFSFDTMAKLLLACILGGIIGAERESENKNAGFRTHILVCVSSALVMITSEYIFNRYAGITSMDPARLGAQVISGIGFLGAGAIIKEGISVRGLTTAASLWASACIGLACGIGFYEGAVLSTLIILATLVILKRVDSMIRKHIHWRLTITTRDRPGQMGAVGVIMGKYNIGIKDIKIKPHQEEGLINVKLALLEHNHTPKREVMDELEKVDGVIRVEME